MAKLVKYTELAATTELEQQVARDIQRALGKRGAKVTHHGTPKGHAPSSAPADITIDWGTGKSASRLLVEVAQRKNESEFTSITEHLNRQVQATRAKNAVNVLYSGISTSVRLTKFIRNENKRREDNNESGRIIFIRLNDLQELLVQWASYPADQYPVEVILTAVSKWQEFTSDLAAYAVLQSVVLPGWSKRQKELDKERQKGVAIPVWRAEFRVIYESRAVIRHYESASSGGNEAAKPAMAANQQKFTIKWKQQLLQHLPNSAANMSLIGAAVVAFGWAQDSLYR